MNNDRMPSEAESEDMPSTPYKPFRIPPFRAFVVRKWNADHTTLVDIVLEAHVVQFIAPAHVQFIDIEMEVDPRTRESAPVSRVHRLIYNVEEVEDTDRPIRPRLLISH